MVGWVERVVVIMFGEVVVTFLSLIIEVFFA